MISGDGSPDNAFNTVPLARLRLTGAPWLKVSDRTLHGIAEDQTSVGAVQSGVVGTQDKNVRNGIAYESPPGVTDAPTSKTVAFQPERVQINERSLRLTADRPRARSIARNRTTGSRKAKRTSWATRSCGCGRAA